MQEEKVYTLEDVKNNINKTKHIMGTYKIPHHILEELAEDDIGNSVHLQKTLVAVSFKESTLRTVILISDKYVETQDIKEYNLNESGIDEDTCAMRAYRILQKIDNSIKVMRVDNGDVLVNKDYFRKFKIRGLYYYTMTDVSLINELLSIGKVVAVEKHKRVNTILFKKNDNFYLFVNENMIDRDTATLEYLLTYTKKPLVYDKQIKSSEDLKSVFN